MGTYTVSAEWAGGWWVLQALEAPGAISQVSRLSEAGDIVEAIAFVTGEPVGDIKFTLRPPPRGEHPSSLDGASDASRRPGAEGLDTSSGFDVKVTRDGEGWLAEIDGLPGAHAHSLEIGSLEERLREVVELVLNVSEGEPTPELRLHY